MYKIGPGSVAYMNTNQGFIWGLRGVTWLTRMYSRGICYKPALGFTPTMTSCTYHLVTPTPDNLMLEGPDELSDSDLLRYVLKTVGTQRQSHKYLTGFSLLLYNEILPTYPNSYLHNCA